MNNVKAFFFDLDGTLIDSEVIYVQAVHESLRMRGAEISPTEVLELVYGRGWHDIYNDSRRIWPGLYESIEDMEDAVREHFQILCSSRDIRIPGSIQLLKKLASSYPVAIVSGSPRQDVEAGIEQLGIGDLLEFYLGSEDYSAGKPDPGCYLLASRRLAVSPQHCVVFEDSKAGVEAAKGAGMFCVGLRRNGTPFQDLSKADLVLPDLTEFDPAKLS